MADNLPMPGGTRLKAHKLPPPAPKAAVPAASRPKRSEKREASRMSSKPESRSGSSVRVAPAAAPVSAPVVAPVTVSPIVSSGDPARDAILEQIRTATTSLANEQRSGFGQKSKDAADYLDTLNKQLAEHDKGVAAANEAAYARDRERAASESVKLVGEVAVGTTAGVMIARSVGKGELARATAKAGEIKTLASQAKAAMAAVTVAKSTVGAIDMVAMGTISLADQRLKDTGHNGLAGSLSDMYHAGLQKLGLETAVATPSPDVLAAAKATPPPAIVAKASIPGPGGMDYAGFDKANKAYKASHASAPRDPAAAPESDGMTDPYVRLDPRTGQMVQVGGFQTPTRSR